MYFLKVFYVLKVLRHGFVSLLHIMLCKYSGLMRVPTVRNIYFFLNPSGQDGQLSWTTRRLYLCICVFARTGGGHKPKIFMMDKKAAVLVYLYLCICNCVFARTGGGHKPRYLWWTKRRLRGEKAGGRGQKCSHPDEGDIIHQPLLPISPPVWKCKKKIFRGKCFFNFFPNQNLNN